MQTKLAVAVLCAVASFALMSARHVAAQAALDPAKAVTPADVQSLLKGKFESRTVEPGIIKYEEVGGPRVVEVSLWIEKTGKSVAGLKAARLQDSEPVEDITGVGDAAIYRPQAGSATVEKKNTAGELQWLEVRVHNVEGASAAADTKRLAIELAKRAAARL